MSAAITAAVVVGGATIYSARKAGKQADKAMAQADAASKLQFEISQQQIDMAKDQWNLYQKEIFPLEQQQQQLGVDRQQLDFDIYEKYYVPLQQEFIAEAMEGVEAQPERAAREARLATDAAFETEEGVRQRQLERRGVRPGTAGAYESGMADVSLNRAAARGFAVNRAVEAERDRAEDVNFARKASALGRAPATALGSGGISPGTAAAGLASAGTTAYGAGSQSARQAGMWGDAAAGGVAGGVQLGMQAYDLFNRYKSPTPSFNPTPVNTGFSPTSFNSYPAPAPTGAAGVNLNVPATMDLSIAGSSPQPTLAPSLGYAEGGMVQPPQLSRGGYANGGVVTGPPGYDQVPARIVSPDGMQQETNLMAGEYVIPADVVAAVGTDPLDEIIERAREKKMKRMEPPNQLSRGRNQ